MNRGQGSSLQLDIVAPGYEPVADLIAGMCEEDQDWAFQLFVRDPDGVALHATARSEVGASNIHLQASVSKGLAGLVVGSLVDRRLIDLEAPVASTWPQFAAHGKARITVAQALSHQAGLIGFRRPLGLASLEDGSAAADLAAQRPRWAPGSAHGYHSFTIGVIADELCRRATGDRIWQQFETLTGDAPAPDVWIRLPPSQHHRLVEVKVDPLPASDPTGSLADDAHAMLNSLGQGNRWLNNRDLVRAGSPAVSAVGSAAGIADSYARALGILGETPLFSAATLAAVGQLRAAGEDLVLSGESRYAVLFQKSRPAMDFGTADAIGHDGAGGGLGFADPRTGVAFGFTTPHARPPGGVDRRALAIAQRIRRIRLKAKT